LLPSSHTPSTPRCRDWRQHSVTYPKPRVAAPPLSGSLSSWSRRHAGDSAVGSALVRRLGNRPMGAARAFGLLLGVVADAAFGDPQHHHPVAAFGRIAAWAEHAWYADRKLAGVIYTGALVGAAAAVGGLLDRVAQGRAAGQTAATALATWVALGAATLAEEGAAMARTLEAGDLDSARARLPHLCGRDPGSLA